MRRICLIVGHPRTDSFCFELASAYEQACPPDSVTRIDLPSLEFDPLLHHGYKQVQELEPDLVHAQQAIAEAEHLVFVFPTWWGSMPALLKGFIDRVFLPGFAFRYHQDDPMWDRLLSGKTADIIMTADAPNFWTSMAYHNSAIHTLKDAVLGFCGVNTRKVLRIGRVKHLSESERGDYLEKVRKLGRKRATKIHQS